MTYELPFMLWDNILNRANTSISVTSEAAGFEKENMSDWLDWTYWKASSTAQQDIDIDKGNVGIPVDTLCLLGHNINDVMNNVQVYEDDNPGFSSPTLLGQDGFAVTWPHYINLTSGTQRYNRIRILSGSVAPEWAICYLGTKMEMPVGPEFSFEPDMQDIKSEKFVSYSGRMISSAFKYSERRMNVPFKRLSQTFIDSDLIEFLEDHYGQMIPFFFVPDPGDEFGANRKTYYVVAPDNPEIELPIYEDDIGFRNWTMRAQGVRQSTFR